VEYVNVQGDAGALTRMLGFSQGQREVPVIVQGNTVQIGYGGGS